jgi:hypothetical protein
MFSAISEMAPEIYNPLLYQAPEVRRPQQYILISLYN